MPGISLDQATTIVRGSCYGSAVEIIDNIFCSNHEKKSNQDVVGMP